MTIQYYLTASSFAASLPPSTSPARRLDLALIVAYPPSLPISDDSAPPGSLHENLPRCNPLVPGLQSLSSPQAAYGTVSTLPVPAYSGG